MHLGIPVLRHKSDVLIVGGGAAGTMAAFECAEAGVSVIQVTKGRATSGTTTVARGGFAAAMGKDDSPELHLQDILKHGGELIDPALARVWVHDIVDVVRDLESWGAEFVRGADGRLDLKMFPSHSRARACHHYDTTGNMITKVLSKKLRADARIEKHSFTSVVDLIKRDGRVVGAWGVDYGNGALVIYQCAANHPVHRRRQRAVLCQRQPATGDGRRLRAGVPRRRAALGHRDDRLSGDVLLAQGAVRLRAAPHRLHQCGCGVQKSGGRGVSQALFPRHRGKIDPFRSDYRHGQGNPRRARRLHGRHLHGRDQGSHGSHPKADPARLQDLPVPGHRHHQDAAGGGAGKPHLARRPRDRRRRQDSGRRPVRRRRDRGRHPRRQPHRRLGAGRLAGVRPARRQKGLGTRQ